MDHSGRIGPLVGQPTGPVQVSPHAVNGAMIRHWVEAMGDQNEAYLDDGAARAEGLPAAIAPPAMLQAWIMRGLRATLELEAARAAGRVTDDSVQATLMQLLDEEGLTSVVATNCEQSYGRPLVVGDRVLARSVLEDVSAPKRTGLGEGRFVTTRTDFFAVPEASFSGGEDPAAVVDRAEPVGTMRFRILKYAPAPRPAAKPRRPRPVMTRDIAWWFEAAREGRLLIQRCQECGQLRHPPLPACSRCRSFEWDTLESSGRGRIFSFVVMRYPEIPGFDYPNPIGLIELEEGTRLVANLLGDPADLAVDQEVECEFVRHDEDLVLPAFRVRSV